MNRCFIFPIEDMEYIRNILDECIEKYMIDSYDITRDTEHCYLACDSEGLFKRYYNYFKCNHISFSLDCGIAF